MKLLVSPVNVREAMAAARGGADIIDMKNPREGSLGANFPWVIREVRESLPSRTELSATLGDLDFKPGTYSLAAHSLAIIGVDYIKAGIFGIREERETVELSEKLVRAIEGNSKLVLAGYADYKNIGSISPFLLPDIAGKTGANVVMIDTARKNGKTLLDHIRLEELAEFVEAAHGLALTVALAGSLGIEEAKKIKEIGADIIGVRGLVCTNGERLSGKISEHRVRKLKEALGD